MTHIGKPWEAVRHDQTAACQRGVVSPKLKIKLAYRCVPTRRGVRGGPGLRKHRKQSHSPLGSAMTFVSQQGGLFTVVMYRAGCGIVINSNGNMKLKR
jgi:hypothetical protein